MAQQNARRRLAESISSSLKSVQVSQTNVEQIDGTETSSSQYEAVSTVTALFPYNHLIRDVQRYIVLVKGIEHWYVFAYLRSNKKFD